MMRSALILALVGGLIHCKKEEAKTPPVKSSEPSSGTGHEAKAPPTTTETKPKAPPAVDEKPGPPKVTVVEAGSEPRRALRYSPKKGTKQNINTKMIMSVETTLKGAKGPTTRMPAMLMTMATVVTEAKDGKFTYEFELTKAGTGDDVKLPKRMIEAVEKELKKTVGLKGKVTVDARGFNVKSELVTPKGMSPRMKQLVSSMQQSLDQLAAPLPEEPVGKGAKWTVEQHINQGGMLLQQITTFELVELDDNSAELTISLKQDAGAQEIRNPGLPTSAKLHKLSGKGTGKSKLRFDRLAPEASNVEVDTSAMISVNVGIQPQTLESRTVMSMTLTGK